MTSQNNPIIVALDYPDLDSVKKTLSQLKGVVSYYKIGFELFTAHGWQVVDLVKNSGAKVFLDLKLHDIPTTVSKTAAVICDHEVDMFNVHTLGGLDMMKKTAEMAGECSKSKKKPVIIGVTVLTSHSEETLKKEIGIPRTPDEQVLLLAKLAHSAGLDGVVSSPREITLIRKNLGEKFVIVTPGIRPAGSETQDQKRVLTPKEAAQAGANYLVIGRPITGASNPKEAAAAILADLS